MKTYFILGTDTGCGKTYVTSQLSQALYAEGHSVLAVKPVASGFNDNGENEDLIVLKAANRLHHIAEEFPISPWQFSIPVSPHLAAAKANKTISSQDITVYCQNLPQSFDYAFVEGAGGLMVPLNALETWLDFLQQSQFPVVLVVGMRLGCLNHALLTAHALTSHGVHCAGWIANCLDPNMLLLQENIVTLEERLTFPCLGIINFAQSFKNFQNQL